jgi:hypothetical protein
LGNLFGYYPKGKILPLQLFWRKIIVLKTQKKMKINTFLLGLFGSAGAL